MARSDVLVAMGWTLVLSAYLAMAIYRKPLARWLVPRNPFWRDRPRAHQVYEATFIFMAVIVIGGTLVVLYQDWSLRRRWQQEIRATEEAIQELSRRLGKPNSDTNAGR